jgi:hypothetical protein
MHLNRFLKNEPTCIYVWNLQYLLQVDQILIFFYFQVNINLEYTYVCQIIHIIVILYQNFNVKVSLNTILIS